MSLKCECSYYNYEEGTCRSCLQDSKIQLIVAKELIEELANNLSKQWVFDTDLYHRAVTWLKENQ